MIAEDVGLILEESLLPLETTTEVQWLPEREDEETNIPGVWKVINRHRAHTGKEYGGYIIVTPKLLATQAGRKDTIFHAVGQQFKEAIMKLVDEENAE